MHDDSCFVGVSFGNASLTSIFEAAIGVVTVSVRLSVHPYTDLAQHDLRPVNGIFIILFCI